MTTERRTDTRERGDPGEVVEVEVERLGVRPTPGQRLRSRVVETVLPILLAMAIDLGDAGLGLVPGLAAVGLPAWLLIGYVFSGYLGVAPTWRLIVTCVVGLYLMLPLTGMLPLATIIAAIVGFLDPQKWREEPFT